MIYNPGDKIVHPRYGLGTVKDSIVLRRKGKEVEHFRIELVEGKGDVMIPVDNVEDIELREPIDSMKTVEDIMLKTPEVLSDHHRSRRASIEKKISSGNPRMVVQVIRDLCWRERIAKLSGSDRRLYDEARKKLMNELKLGTSTKLIKVRQHLDRIIERAMNHHMDEQGVAPVQ